MSFLGGMGLLPAGPLAAGAVIAYAIAIKAALWKGAIIALILYFFAKTYLHKGFLGGGFMGGGGGGYGAPYGRRRRDTTSDYVLAQLGIMQPFNLEQGRSMSGPAIDNLFKTIYSMDA